jgi:hypothetical protein
MFNSSNTTSFPIFTKLKSQIYPLQTPVDMVAFSRLGGQASPKILLKMGSANGLNSFLIPQRWQRLQSRQGEKHRFWRRF